MLTKTIPGTNIAYSDSDNAFSVFRPMIEITGGLSLGQICTITGLQSSTIQNWVKRGFVPHPENKKYYERHLSRILLISALRDCLDIDEIGELMKLINGDTDDESDDIISESRLFDYFCIAVKNMEQQSLSDDYISEKLEAILQGEEVFYKEKLFKALKVMVYGYIVGVCLGRIDKNMDALREDNKQ